MTTRESEIFNIIKKDPMATQEFIAETLGITRSAVSVHISNLMKQGYIKGRGYVINQESYTVVIGSAGIDIVGVMRPDSEDSAVTYIMAQFGDVSITSGGAGLNIAEYMARLGENVKLITNIASDMFGQQLVRECELLRIDTTCCRFMPDTKQDMMVQLRDPVDHTRKGVINYRTGETLTAEFLESQSGILRGASRLVVTDVLTREALEYLLSTFADKEIWCIFSGVLSRLENNCRTLLNRFSVVYMNRDTADYLLRLKRPATPARYAEAFARMGIREAYISCENREMICYAPSQFQVIPLPSGISCDNERGKDAVSAGLVCARQWGYNSAAEQVRFAAACGLVSAEAVGDQECLFNAESIQRRMETIPLRGED